MIDLPFLSEVSETEGSRGLGFALAAHADDDEDEDGNEVGDHLAKRSASVPMGSMPQFT